MLVEFSCFGHSVNCLSESLLTFLSSTKPKPRIAWEVAGVKELLSNCCHFDATFSAVFYRTSALSLAAKGCTILGLQRGEASQGLESPHFFGPDRRELNKPRKKSKSFVLKRSGWFQVDTGQ